MTERKTLPKVRRVAALVLVSAGAGLVACAGQPVDELVDARKEYEAARTGVAMEKAPDRVYEAQQALKKAERVRQTDPGSNKVKHYGYIAKRKAQLAQAYGDIAAAREEADQAQVAYRDMLEQLAQLRREIERHQLMATQEMAEQERQARLAAEERADDAQSRLEQELEKVGQVREDARGMVITMPGAVLFEHDQATLSSSARARLAEVARVLSEHATDQQITVEGYTDSTGPADYNDKLSQQRAESVRQYLIQQGIEADRIEAVGRGEANPIAPNDSPSSRAMNRRVEIVISREGRDSM